MKEAAQPEPAPKSDKQFVTVEEILTGHTDQTSPAPTGSNTPLAFVSSSSSLYTMGDIQRKLHKQGSYRVLTHTAWRQPAFTGNNEQGVHVFGGKLLDDQGPVGARYEFEGLISLRSSRYLHLDVDALLREAESKQSGENSIPLLTWACLRVKIMDKNGCLFIRSTDSSNPNAFAAINCITMTIL